MPENEVLKRAYERVEKTIVTAQGELDKIIADAETASAGRASAGLRFVASIVKNALALVNLLKGILL